MLGIEGYKQIVDDMKHAFLFPVLLGGIQIRELDVNTISFTKYYEIGSFKFLSIFFFIVTLKSLNFIMKLGFNKTTKMEEFGENFIF